MSENQPDPAPLDRALHRAHRSVLALLALCALVIVAGGFGGEEPPLDRSIATLGVLLGLGTIVVRRLGSSPAIHPRTAVLLALSSFVLAGGLGLLGVYLAWSLEAARSGLLFTLAGAIFCLRPPVRVKGG